MSNPVIETLSPRRRLDLSDAWIFRRARVRRRWLCGTDVSGGETVSLPHCWNRTDTFQTGVIYYRGYGAYRRTFVCPEQMRNGQTWLCSEGFFGISEFWVNGHRIGRASGQYLGVRLPVGRYLRPGTENHIGCRLTNRCGRRELPGIRDPDFLLYGGLAGRVWLERTEDCHLDDRDLHIVAVGGTSPRVEARAKIVNSGPTNKTVSVLWTLATTDGSVLAAQKSRPQVVSAGFDVTVDSKFSAEAVHPWSVTTPHLYQMQATLLLDDQPADCATRKIGFRTAEFRPREGFFLNGERLPLIGCNRHESMPGCGNALSVEQHRTDAAAIREIGMNFVRLSHYPQSPAFLDACDELGILVYAELASWKSVRGGSWLQKALRQFDGMIRRDRHHPSVILWGMGNEGRHRGAFIKLRSLAKKLDATRPVIYAENHLYRARRKKTVGLPDVWGCNYELNSLEEGRDASRLSCVVVSECSNAPHARRGDLEAERQQIDQLAADLTRIEPVPFTAGFAIWCLSDYATLRKARYLRHCGVVDAWREPKLTAFWLRARYSREPFIKLAADWQPESGAIGDPRRVDLFMNVGETEIRINNRPIQIVYGRGHHVLQLPFEPGRLEATGLNAGNTGDTIESFGPATRLKLSALDGVPAVLRLEVLDSAGRLVRNWHGDADLRVRGGARAFPYSTGKILVAAGTARIPVFVEATSCASEWQVSAGGLAPATLSVSDPEETSAYASAEH